MEKFRGSMSVDVDCEHVATCFHCQEGPESWARIPRPNLQELQKVPTKQRSGAKRFECEYDAE